MKELKEVKEICKTTAEGMTHMSSNTSKKLDHVGEQNQDLLDATEYLGMSPTLIPKLNPPPCFSLAVWFCESGHGY